MSKQGRRLRANSLPSWDEVKLSGEAFSATMDARPGDIVILANTSSTTIGGKQVHKQIAWLGAETQHPDDADMDGETFVEAIYHQQHGLRASGGHMRRNNDMMDGDYTWTLHVEKILERDVLPDVTVGQLRVNSPNTLTIQRAMMRHDPELRRRVYLDELERDRTA